MFKNRNLPKDATPWGREVESRIEDIESALKIIKSANASNTSQLQSTFNNTSAIWNNFNSVYSRTGKNVVINGAMDIWQRGTSSTAAGYCCADRWFLYASAGTLTGAQESTIIPSGFLYALRLSSSAASVVGIRQIIENQNAAYFGGKTVTVSAYVAASSVPEDFNIVLKTSPVVNALSTDTSWTELNITASDGTVTSANTYSRIYATFNVPANCETLMLSIEASVAASANIYITGIQLEAGSTATDFTRAGGTLQGELSNCQRYFYRYYPPSAGSGIFPSWGLIVTTTTSRLMVPLPVPMRITPTAIDISAIGDWAMAEAPSRRNLSALTIDTAGSSTTLMTLNGTHATATSAVNSVAYIAASPTSTTSSFIGFSAELL